MLAQPTEIVAVTVAASAFALVGIPRKRANEAEVALESAHLAGC